MTVPAWVIVGVGIWLLAMCFLLAFLAGAKRLRGDDEQDS